MEPLHTMNVILASPSTKIQLSILSCAMVDALGGLAEFKPRFSFPQITSMLPNHTFNLPPGVWTDDTSMTLCLAHSITTSTQELGFEEGHQLDAYKAWWENGFLSATGDCFDVGNTILNALSIWSRKSKLASTKSTLQEIKQALDGEYCAGNGSLMRILPVPLAYWKLPAEKVDELAARSSATTHPNSMCIEACQV
jgi:ADP-ribosyl-[dinitrogen reductase] hydrolase